MGRLRDGLRDGIEYKQASEFDDNDKVVDMDAVNEILDDLEREIITIRKKLERVQGLDLIDEVIDELTTLETGLYE